MRKPKPSQESSSQDPIRSIQPSPLSLSILPLSLSLSTHPSISPFTLFPQISFTPHPLLGFLHFLPEMSSIQTHRS
ncbi:hypothetical protein RJT34_08343 [Clitoria ternatea]|uniref:Uncharacterized protein n=1 Tax=Clitoria ternatea TaxID=43366 RepID=A0AAN9PUT0_CLITE